MFSSIVRKSSPVGVYEQLSLLLLIPATVLYTIAAVSHSWFELPGVAWYGIWLAEFLDLQEKTHWIPAFFTNEPGLYHLLQLIFLFSWAGLGLATWMLVSERVDPKIPRFLKKNLNRQHTVALICFTSVFAMTSVLYLFYHIVNNFPRDSGKYPEMHWAGQFASVACGLQFIAGILLLQT